jgi:hypothetical protein
VEYSFLSTYNVFTYFIFDVLLSYGCFSCNMNLENQVFASFLIQKIQVHKM